MFNITLYILYVICDMYNVLKLNVHKCKRECCKPEAFTHPPPHDMCYCDFIILFPPVDCCPHEHSDWTAHADWE